MSKGLEALERVEKQAILTGRYTQDLDTIEKELKDYQEVSIKYKLAIEFIDNIADEFGEHDLDELADKIVKVKKVLEIIKNKNVNTFGIKHSKDIHEYNLTFASNGKEQLTQDEYELLKEVLL